MNHTYFLVSIDFGSNGQTLWEHEANRLWEKYEPDHSLLDDPECLILSGEQVSQLLKCDCQGFMIEEFDSTVTNTLWAEYGDDDGGPAQITPRLLLDKDLGGDWQVVESNP